MGRFGLVGVRDDSRGGGYDVSVGAGWQAYLIIVSAALVSNDGSDFFILLKLFVAL